MAKLLNLGEHQFPNLLKEIDNPVFSGQLCELNEIALFNNINSLLLLQMCFLICSLDISLVPILISKAIILLFLLRHFLQLEVLNVSSK